MADITTTYPGQAVQTTTPGLGGFSVPGLPGSGGGPDFTGLMRWKMALEQQRAADEARLRALQMKQMQQSMQMQRQAFYHQPQQQEQRGLTPNEQNMQTRAQQAQLALQEAAARPMPTKLIQGPQIISGYAPDTTQLPVGLLPKSAHMLPSEGSPDTFGQHQQMDQRRKQASVPQPSLEDVLRQAARRG